MAGMRIGVNALYLIPGGVGGTEIYLRNLLAALSRIDSLNQYYVFTNRETDTALVPDAPNFKQVPQALSALNRPARLLWEQAILPIVAVRLRLSCLLNPGFTAPAWTVCPNVTVFHDLQHKVHPEHFRSSDLPFWNLFLWIAVKRSAKLLADSDATRLDIERYYQGPRHRVEVAPLGAEQEFFDIAGRRGSTDELLLCVSTLHPHKNLVRLVRVFATLHAEKPSLRLVIAGLRGFHAPAVEAAIGEHALQDAVQLTGWIPRQQLYELFLRARAFVYPSTFEGFGLPVVEAMAAGIPLACSSIEPLRSIVSDAAELFDPESDEQMLDCLRTVLNNEDRRAKLIELGRARAAHFQWDTSARITLEALRKAAST